MHTRLVFLTGLSALLFCLLWPVTAMAGTKVIHIRRGATVDPGATYPDLETLREALDAHTASLEDGTEIVLHNHDASLSSAFIIPAGIKVTVKSAGGARYRVESAAGPKFFVGGDTPDLTVDNLHFVSNTASVFAGNTTGSASGTLNVANSLFEGNSAADISSMGQVKTTVTNTIIKGSSATGVQIDTGYMNALGIYSGSAELNVVFDANSPVYNHWDKGIALLDSGPSNGAATVNVDVARGRVFNMGGELTTTSDVSSTVNMNGGGVWKINGGNANRLNIDNGTVHFKSGSVWSGDTISVGANGVFKLTYDPGNVQEYFASGAPDNMTRTDSASRFYLTSSFQSVEGARTEIANISKHPLIPIRDSSGKVWTFGQYMISVPKGTTENSTFAASMNINNKLMKGTWYSGDSSETDISTSHGKPVADKDNWFFVVERLESLSVLEGLGTWADTYRMMDLSEAERDMLDTIYCTGGSGGLGYLQTLGGYHVQNSMLAMRDSSANMTKRVNQRLTRYQKEELEISSTPADELCDYADYVPYTEYGEMWAWADQTWTKQDDVDNIAGYRSQAHTLGVGYDWHRDNLIWGGVMSYAGGDTKLQNNHSARTDFDHLLAALYASWAQEGYYISGSLMAAYGWNDSKSSYTLGGNGVHTSTGDYATSLFGANLEAGYMFETEFQDTPLRITPYGSLTYARIHRNAVRESGGESGAVNMNRQFRAANWPMWDAAIGLRLAAPINRCGYTLIPSLDVAWTRTMGETDTGGGDVWFVNRPGSGWQIPLMAGNRSSLRVGAGLEARIRDNLSIGGGYNFEWRENSWSHQLNLNMALGF